MMLIVSICRNHHTLSSLTCRCPASSNAVAASAVSCSCRVARLQQSGGYIRRRANWCLQHTTQQEHGGQGHTWGSDGAAQGENYVL